jgi:hypothetical protein
MAKADKPSTPETPIEAARRDIAASLRNLQQRLQQAGIRFPTQQEAQAQAEKHRKWAAMIDRYNAIRDNQIPPLWLNKTTPKPKPSIAPLKAKDWLFREIKRRQKLNDIPLEITAFARELHPQMKAAVRDGAVDHAMAEGTIINWLRNFGLFPPKKR